MVEQDYQQGQQYLISQHDMDSITQTSSLNSPMNDDWLTVDITCLKETASLSQVNSEIDISIQNLKTQDSTIGKLDYELNNQFLSIQDSNIIDVTSPGFYDSSDLNVDIPVINYPRISPLLWNSFMDTHNFKMDDVFQVDKADLFHGPTLAELNANDESLFDSFDSFESCLPSENKASSFQFQALNTFGLAKELNNTDNDFKEKMKDIDRSRRHVPLKENEMIAKSDSEIHLDFSFGGTMTTSTITASSDSSLDIGKITIIGASNIATNVEDSGLQAVPSETGNSRSVSLNLKIANKIMPSEELDFFGSKNELVHSNSRLNDPNTVSSLSNDEIDNKDDNTDEDFIFSSDYDSDASEQTCHKRSGTRAVKSNKKPRYFWQYNMQAKGPKGQKMESFEHSHASDVSSVNSLLKVRRGDGNDLTPCPQKLYNIGMELQKLNSTINNLTPVNKLPFNARLKSRKEKNKLASRACRLKKKAQHEANKLKLFGLQEEYDTLMDVLNEMKKVLMAKMQTLESQMSCEEEMKLLLLSKGIKQVAGCTAEFVNSVLNSVEAGDSTGGLINL